MIIEFILQTQFGFSMKGDFGPSFLYYVLHKLFIHSVCPLFMTPFKSTEQPDLRIEASNFLSERDTRAQKTTDGLVIRMA